jgi:hypothetical protein
MKQLKALLSNGKDKLDVFLSEYKRNAALDVKTNHFNKGDIGRRLAVILLIIAAVWFVYRLFS